MKILAVLFSGFVFGFVMGLLSAHHNVEPYKSEIRIDFPEEFELANEKDTLEAVKKNDSLIIQFRNK